MGENEPKKEEGTVKRGRSDYFWVIIVAGIIVVTVGALFTGSYLARVFLKGDQGEEIIIAPEALNIPDSEYVEPDYGPAEEELPPVPANGSDDEESDAAIKKPVANETSEKTPEEKDLPPPEIDISDVVKSPAEAPEEPETETAKPADAAAPEPAASVPAAASQPESDAGNTAQAEQDENVIYVLQLGVYKSRENADRMKKTLEETYNMDVYIAEIETDGEIRYRVQIGAFRDKKNAQKLGRELQIEGYRYYISSQELKK